MEIATALEALDSVAKNYSGLKSHLKNPNPAYSDEAIINTLEMESRRIGQASKVIHDELQSIKTAARRLMNYLPDTPADYPDNAAFRQTKSAMDKLESAIGQLS